MKLANIELRHKIYCFLGKNVAYSCQTDFELPQSKNKISSNIFVHSGVGQRDRNSAELVFNLNAKGKRIC